MKNKIILRGGTDFKDGDIVTYGNMIYIILNNMAKNLINYETIEINNDMRIMNDLNSADIEDFHITLIFKGYSKDRNILCLRINGNIIYAYSSLSDLGDWKLCTFYLTEFLKTGSYTDGFSLYYKIQYFIDMNIEYVYEYHGDIELPSKQVCSDNKINEDTEYKKIFNNESGMSHILFNSINYFCQPPNCFNTINRSIHNDSIDIRLQEKPCIENILSLVLKSIINPNNINNKNIYNKVYDCIGAYVALFINSIDKIDTIDMTKNNKAIDKNIYKSIENDIDSTFEVKKIKYNIYKCTFKIPDSKRILNVYDKYFSDYIIDTDMRDAIILESKKILEDHKQQSSLKDVLIGTNTYILNYIDKITSQQIPDTIIELPFTICKEFKLFTNGVNNNYYRSGIFVSKPLEYRRGCYKNQLEELLSNGEYYLLLMYMKNIFNIKLLGSLSDIRINDQLISVLSRETKTETNPEVIYKLLKKSVDIILNPNIQQTCDKYEYCIKNIIDRKINVVDKVEDTLFNEFSITKGDVVLFILNLIKNNCIKDSRYEKILNQKITELIAKLKIPLVLIYYLDDFLSDGTRDTKNLLESIKENINKGLNKSDIYAILNTLHKLYPEYVLYINIVSYLSHLDENTKFKFITWCEHEPIPLISITLLKLNKNLQYRGEGVCYLGFSIINEKINNNLMSFINLISDSDHKNNIQENKEKKTINL